MTNNNLAKLNPNEMTKEQILALTGQSAMESKGYYLPRLAINKDPDEGPVGTFVIPDPDNSTQDNKRLIYGKTVHFRTFINAYQYRKFDPNAGPNGKGEIVNRSIIFQNMFNDEAIDMLGTVKCGKVKKADLESLPGDIVADQKLIKCYRLMYGVATMTGVDKDGEEVTLTEVPLIVRTSGSNFIPPGDALKKLVKQNKLIHEYDLVITTVKDKTGSNIFYRMNFDIDDKNKHETTSENIELMQRIHTDVIDRENRFIEAKYREAGKTNTPSTRIESEVVGDILDADFEAVEGKVAVPFDDKLPF